MVGMSNDIGSADKAHFPPSIVRPRFRFAPEGRAPTTLLEAATFYFWLNGVLYALSFLLFLLFMLGAVFLSKFHVGIISVVSALLGLIAAVAFFWTARFLDRREQIGGYLGFFAVLISSVPMVFGYVTGFTVGWTILSLIILIAIWPDLAMVESPTLSAPQPRRKPDTNSTVRPRFRFAPVSGDSSSWVDIAGGYFMLNGALNGLIIVGALVALVVDPTIPAPKGWLLVLGVSFQIVAAIGLFWTGILIGRRSEIGGFLALGFTVLQLLPLLFGEWRWDILIWPILTLIVLKVIWKDLA